MGNNITDRLKYKESIVKFSRKYGVAKAAYKFGVGIFDTDGCILKTAFDLFENNIRTYILQDYCMSSGGEKYHYEAIDILKRSIGEKFII